MSAKDLKPLISSLLCEVNKLYQHPSLRDAVVKLESGMTMVDWDEQPAAEAQDERKMRVWKLVEAKMEPKRRKGIVGFVQSPDFMILLALIAVFLAGYVAPR